MCPALDSIHRQWSRCWIKMGSPCQVSLGISCRRGCFGTGLVVAVVIMVMRGSGLRDAAWDKLLACAKVRCYALWLKHHTVTLVYCRICSVSVSGTAVGGRVPTESKLVSPQIEGCEEQGVASLKRAVAKCRCAESCRLWTSDIAVWL